MKKTIYSKEHKQLVDRLKKARISNDLDQSHVAKLLHKTQSYVSKLESGQCRIDIIQLKQLARIYKRDVNYFIEG
jgi:transcriptional regulator with XRE-family HTH domain